MTDLPMQYKHQRLIIDSRRLKTTTLRGKPLDAGEYRMVARGGASLGNVSVEQITELGHWPLKVQFEDDGSVNWCNQTYDGKAVLADREGQYTVAEFERFMLGFGRGMGKRFINGERNLFLHGLTWLGVNDD